MLTNHKALLAACIATLLACWVDALIQLIAGCGGSFTGFFKRNLWI